ncbi:MAG: ABC transporter substrate-binding protein [Hyphomicrobiales bacterium]|nr:ABC transporter substrate-binding protein [Hyphomicrobiales bacterium]
MSVRASIAVAAAIFCLNAGAAPAVLALDLVETPTLSNTHQGIDLPPVAERVPSDPLVVDPAAMGRTPGRHGGTLHTLIGRSKDVRLINVWGYARLVGYDEKLKLVPDILAGLDIEDGRVFTLRLRPGHKWSDGHPFTAEDFRYYWEDIANNEELSPGGVPAFFLVDGEKPQFSVIDEVTVRFEWQKPNPGFLPNLAKARPTFIYRPAHYLRQFHSAYGDHEKIEELMEANKLRSWAAVHNKKDEMYKAGNPDMPTLQPWVVLDSDNEQHRVAIRNPYFHRVDAAGRQLPYIDEIDFSVTDGRLIATKTQAGESDLQARGLAFSDITVLKRGENAHGYTTRLWPNAKAAEIALYPNLTVQDPMWRNLLNDKRFRHALSLGIDRDAIGRVLFFGYATGSNNTVLPASPLYKEDYRTSWAGYDPKMAAALLDEIGLTTRRGDGIRLLSDGRPLEIIVETAGESTLQADALELIGETWRELGIALFIKPTQREVMRNRALSGQLVMSVWSGHDNGVPTADMPPEEYAPVNSETLCWPGWGQYFETEGNRGEAPEDPAAQKLVDLYRQWIGSRETAEREAIWHEILGIHAEETFSIGLVSEARQPVVVAGHLQNVPETGIYGWDPGAQFGIHHMDLFWFDDAK